MKNSSRKALLLVAAFLCLGATVSLQAQNYVSAQPKGDVAVPFKLSDTGTKHASDLKWGADIASLQEINLSRSAAFMEDALQVVRTSFQPTADVGTTVGSGSLSTDQITALDTRIGWLDKHVDKTKVGLVLNCDHPKDENENSLSHTSYKPTNRLGDNYVSGTSSNIVKRWANLIDLSKTYYESAGYTVASIAPLNEPDYDHGYLSTTSSYNQNLFKYLAQSLKNRYSGIRICGPNTLDPKNAGTWFSKITSSYLDEVNTHELGGHYGSSSGFDTWVSFYDDHTDKHITNDEMHNIMEGMVGLEHGLQTGIWWGPAEYVRGEFCKATHGSRLAYAEDRTKWTAASVYRTPNGKIQAFGGTSERNAQTTDYRFVSTERDVFFDGQGPMREYTMHLPGGTAYATGQTNAEGVVNITYGEDIQPYLNGKSVFFNKSTNRVLELKFRNTATGTHLAAGTYNIAKDYCQWNVEHVPNTTAGGFSYYNISSATGNLYLDCFDSRMESGTPIGVYTKNGDIAAQRWYFDYAGDGWFHVRSGCSALCLAVASDGSICQKTKDASDATQLWRILPAVDASLTVRSVDAPTGVSAQAQNASVKLTWNKGDRNLSYSVFKSETSQPAEYELIARNIEGTEFVDNKVVKGKTYYYVVKAVDATLNTSSRSAEVSAVPTGTAGAVLDCGFERVMTDASVNKNTPSSYNTPEYETGRESKYDAVVFDGENFLQLSTAVASHDAITVAAWVNWTGTTKMGERIFEFATDANNYFYLTPSNTNSQVCAGIKTNGTEVKAAASATLNDGWHHIAVTLDGSNMKLYIDGTQKASVACTQKPSTFLPFRNTIGSGQASDAANFKGSIDNFQVYNYAMTASDIATLKGTAENTEDKPSDYPVLTDYIKNPEINDGTNNWTWNGEGASLKLASNQSNDITGTFIECWEGGSYVGKVQQTVTNLPDGVYEFKAAVFRSGYVGTEANSVYLFAGSNETLVSTTVGTYHSVLVDVTGGSLVVGLESKAKSYQWMGIDNASLSYYGDVELEDVLLKNVTEEYEALQVTAEEMLQDEKYAVVVGSERASLDALRKVTPEKTESGYTTAINNLQNGINTFKAALSQYRFFKQELDNAGVLGLDVATELALFNSASVTAAQLESNFPALYEKVNAEIDRRYEVDQTTLVGTLSTWENDMVNQTNDQHWDGKSTPYLEMQGEKWGLSSWTTYAEKKVTLPAGRYALRAVGRASSTAVEMNISVDYDQVSYLANKGDGGRGVTTSGEKTFDASKTYVNNNNGRGWEYRTLLFELEEEREVVLRFDAVVTSATQQWCGLTQVELWQEPDVVTLKMSDAGWSTLMLPFDHAVPAELTAYSCNTLKHDKYLSMTEETSLKANTPYVMSGEAGIYTFKGLKSADKDSYSVGYLTGVYVDTPAPVGSYVLQRQDGGEVAFHQVVSVQPTVKANRAYVMLPEAGSNVLMFLFEDDVTEIESVLQDWDAVVDVYTLDGLPVCTGVTFGDALKMLKKNVVYVIGGRKFMLK